ncbi:hypothetical protein BCU70_10140 [Vibrio sp. 10N.286.49.C2]|uniref:hypothetical protein n=1 Tax=unclassified Vibrio TaxID=2614977 RepID=UPI000C833723|nr:MULTISPECIES: hypothetical protein [unclassified Vibrio]PMH26496.1 hypothetical protein BCU70_10140 [Vibrio sp. 10N.286.49.C2]PMH54780.1 hypothetical protein BCU66_10795 [Vibrio sp. 10N.286.49.B1]PMH82521.1 hypothetical protein BCU58_18020 [Vibrio sp. 10N.286.48.B7]
MKEERIVPVTLKFTSSFLAEFEQHLEQFNVSYGKNLKRASLMKFYVEENMALYTGDTITQFSAATSALKANPDLLELVKVWIEQQERSKNQ